MSNKTKHHKRSTQDLSHEARESRVAGRSRNETVFEITYLRRKLSRKEAVIAAIQRTG